MSLRSQSLSREYTVEQVKAIITAEYGGVMTSVALGARFNTSGTNMSQAFRRVEKRTLHSYVREVRMKHAMELVTSGVKIDAIARMVGYKSKKNFYRAFSETFGQLPGAAQRAARKQ